jgi:hypothetical protein
MHCPIQNAGRDLKPRSIDRLMHLVRVATNCCGPRDGAITWSAPRQTFEGHKVSGADAESKDAMYRYMVLCALISGVAVGEPQRTSKLDGASKHRCQVSTPATHVGFPEVSMFCQQI